MDEDILFMKRAVQLAREALAENEVPVGALVVKDGVIVGEGRNRREATESPVAHAEIEAIEKACCKLGNWRLSDCTLYVTLEPCPMCAGALFQSRVGRIVFGASDAAAGALGGCFNLTEQIKGWTPEIRCGVLGEECSGLLGSFFFGLRPHEASKRLPREFYSRPADTVACEMLGKYLCVKSADGSGTVLRRRITETEAYFGDNDSASHAYHGETDRNRPMFGKGGTVYVYLCYGMHNMLNIATGEKGRAEAVLIRGTEDADGPGKLTKLFSVDRKFNGADCVLSDRIWLEDSGEAQPLFSTGPRIGIDYALEEDRNRPLRFFIKNKN